MGSSRVRRPAAMRPRILELIAACELADDGLAEVDEHDITVGFGRYGFDPALDSLLVFERDELVACGRDLPGGAVRRDVRPSHRGRGIGAALLGWIERRATELPAAEVGQSKTDADTAARELFLANDYEPSWTSWMIQIGLDGPPPPPRAGRRASPSAPTENPTPRRSTRSSMPRSASGRDATRSRSRSGLHRSSRTPPPGRSSPRSRSTGTRSSAWSSRATTPSSVKGWIQQLATRASHRRRGIAQAMLLTAFGWFYEAGRRVAGVSTDSRTGALGLYEKVGMRVERQYTRYRKQLDDTRAERARAPSTARLSRPSSGEASRACRAARSQSTKR